MSSSDEQSLAHDWPVPQQFRRSIRLEFSLYVSALILALMSVTGYVITQQYVATVTEGVVENILTQARSYAQAAGKHIIAGDRPDVLMLNNICTKLKSGNPAVYWVGIVDQENLILAHTDVTQLTSGGQLLFESSDEYIDQLRPEENLALRSDTIYVRAPIREQGITVGQLQLAASAARIAEVRRTTILTVAMITLLMLAIGIPITMVLTRRQLRPVELITDSLRNVDLENFSVDPPVRLSNEFGFLAETLRVMGRRLNRAQNDLVEKERRDRELEIARELQARILPKTLPSSDHFQFRVTYQSAKEVGGDYYDVIDFGDGEIAFIIADVSGKSLPGMLVMLMTRDIVRNCVRTDRQPAAVLSTINRELRSDLKRGMFVTMFYGLLDTRTGRLRFASAGHNPLIKISAQNRTEERIKTRGYPLGLMAPEQFDDRIETAEIHLSDGDRVIQYTDGINEAQNTDGEEFGMERFSAALLAHAQANPVEYINRVMDEHRRFVAEADPFDDVTLLALMWTVPCADTTSICRGEAANAT